MNKQQKMMALAVCFMCFIISLITGLYFGGVFDSSDASGSGSNTGTGSGSSATQPSTNPSSSGPRNTSIAAEAQRQAATAAAGGNSGSSSGTGFLTSTGSSSLSSGTGSLNSDYTVYENVLPSASFTDGIEYVSLSDVQDSEYGYYTYEAWGFAHPVGTLIYRKLTKPTLSTDLVTPFFSSSKPMTYLKK